MFEIYIICSRSYAVTEKDIDRLYKALEGNGDLTPYNTTLVFRQDNSVLAKSIHELRNIKNWKALSCTFGAYQRKVFKNKYKVLLNKSFQNPSKVTLKVVNNSKIPSVLIGI
tara:strand:- start:5570 stop:5905 length:336 start_codon:yes stop_codon:yes gene_type:complete